MSSTGKQFKASAGQDGRFQLLLPSGTYQITGQSPELAGDGAGTACHAKGAITVETAVINDVQVICSVR